MSIEPTTSMCNVRPDAIETDVGTSEILKIRTGVQPANCAAAESGTVLATLNSPSDCMEADVRFRLLAEHEFEMGGVFEWSVD